MNMELIVTLIIPIAISGILSGIIAGLFGVGGGIILVPAIVITLEFLDYSPSITMHLAVATSLAIIVPTAISSSFGHHKKGVIDYEIIRSLYLTIIIGSILGGIMAQRIPGDGLRLIFGLAAAFSSINMMRKTQFTIGKSMPKNNLVNSSIGFSIGSISSMIGIGGGAFFVPLLNGFSVSHHKATGTAAFLGLVIAVPGTIVFSFADTHLLSFPPWSFGMISLPIFLIFVPLTIIGAQFGVIIAHKLDGLLLRRLFSIFLFLMAIRMIIVAVY